jgi:hypothetical protein
VDHWEKGFELERRYLFNKKLFNKLTIL